MRVAVVAGSYRPDRCGVAHYTEHLRAALAERGVETVVLTDRESAAAAGDPSVRAAVRGWRARDLLSLVREVRASGADLLHVQHAAGTYGFRRAVFLLPPLLRAAGWRAPLVTTLHEYGWWEWTLPGPLEAAAEWAKEWGQTRGWWDREDGFLLTGSDALVATHADAERAVRRRLPALAERLHRIPVGANVAAVPVERAAARAALRARCGWPAESRVVAYFGFLHPVKGLETLLPAFRRVLHARPDARLLLAGGVDSLALRGEAAERYREELRARVAALGLEERVHMTGYLPAEDVSRLLSGADLGVLPFNHGVTLKSGSLLALLAHRLATVVTRADPPVPELEAGALARSVPPRDEARLAEALLGLLDGPRDAARMGEAGSAFAGRFSWPEIARRHLEVYEGALAVRGAGVADAGGEPGVGRGGRSRARGTPPPSAPR